MVARRWRQIGNLIPDSAFEDVRARTGRTHSVSAQRPDGTFDTYDPNVPFDPDAEPAEPTRRPFGVGLAGLARRAPGRFDGDGSVIPAAMPRDSFFREHRPERREPTRLDWRMGRDGVRRTGLMGGMPNDRRAAHPPAQAYLKARETRPTYTPERVEDRLDNLLSRSHPLMQRARMRAVDAMNARGLTNSSLAVGAAQQATLDAALPIAMADVAAGNEARASAYRAQVEMDLMREKADIDQRLQTADGDLRMQLLNRQAEIDATMQDTRLDWQAGQSSLDRGMTREGWRFQASQAEHDREWRTAERTGSQAFQARQQATAQNWQSMESKLHRAHQASLQRDTQAFTAEQNAALRKWQSGESLSARDWQTLERIAGQEFTTAERQDIQSWQTSERFARQEYTTAERESVQRWQSGERMLSQDWQTLERIAGQEFATAERRAVNAWRTGERVGSQAFQSRENGFLRNHQSAMTTGGWRANLYGAALTSYVGIITADSTDVDKAAAIDRLIAWVNAGNDWIDSGADATSEASADTDRSTASPEPTYSTFRAATTPSEPWFGTLPARVAA